MRSRRTTYLLLLLALLFILVIIILCLIPVEKDPVHPLKHGGISKNKFEATKQSSTTSATFTTVKESSTTKHPTTVPSTFTTAKYNTTHTTVSSTLAPRKSHETGPPSTLSSTSTNFPSTTASSTHSSSSSTTRRRQHRINNTSTTAAFTRTTASSSPSTLTQTSTITSAKMSTTSTTLPTTTSTTSTTNPSTPTTSTTHQSTSTTTIPSTTIVTTTSTTTIIPSTSTSTTSTTTPSTTSTTTTNTPPATSTTTSTTLRTTSEVTTTEYSHDFHLYDEPNGICTSSECKDVAAKMLDSIDHSVDACQNFYEYSCGGVRKDDFLLAEDPEDVLNSIIAKQLLTSETDAVELYDSCMTSLLTPKSLDIKVVYPELIINSSYSREDTGPSDNLSRLLSNFLKMDIPLLFDVTIDIVENSGAKFVPRLNMLPFRFRAFSGHNVDTAVCKREFDERLKTIQRSGDAKVDFNSEYNNTFLDCMNTTGIEARIEFIKRILDEHDIFGKSWSYIEKQFLFHKLRTFLEDINEVLDNFAYQKMHSHSEERMTLKELKNDPQLGNLINWDLLFMNFFGTKIEGTQQLIVSSKEALSHFIRENQHDSMDLEIFMVMLAAEQLYMSTKPLPKVGRSEFCLEITKDLLPDDVLLTFAKSFSKYQLQKLSGEIKTLASFIASEFVSLNLTSETFNFKNFSAVHKVYPEFIDVATTEAYIRKRKDEVTLTADYLENVRKLREKKRRDMYSLLTKNVTQKYCKFLPKDLSSRCNLILGRISIAVESLVAPNYYKQEKMPNYLRLAGVSTYIAKAMIQEVSNFALEGYEHEDCIANKFPNTFNVKTKNGPEVTYHIKGKQNAKELFEDFKIFNIIWRVLRKLSSENPPLSLNETKELPLIWMGDEPLQPLKAFLIRKAQTFCRDFIGFDFLSAAVNFNKFPNSFWINTLLQTDNLVAASFNCPPHTPMGLHRECETKRVLPRSSRISTKSHGFPQPLGFLSTSTESVFVPYGRHPEN